MFTIAVPSSQRATRPSFRAALVALVAFGTLLGGGVAAAAERLTASDRLAIEQTIRLQIDAFEHDDADRAFGFATSEIQRLFGSSDEFLESVRDHYEPVYRPASVRFDRVSLVDGEWIQAAEITDGEGRVWHALFTMRRQADRGWKVGGCQLVETSAIET